MYFVRFTNNPELDAERGYSFAGYQLFDTRDEAIAEFVNLHGEDEELIAQDNITKRWGRRLSGLCGFGPFETLDEANEFIVGFDGDYSGPVSVFKGQESFDPNIDGCDDEGIRFIPESILPKSSD